MKEVSGWKGLLVFLFIVMPVALIVLGTVFSWLTYYGYFHPSVCINTTCP